MAASAESDLPDRDEVRALTLTALKRLDRPAHRDEVIQVALELGAFTKEQLSVPPPTTHQRWGSMIGYWLFWSLTEHKKTGAVENPSPGYWELIAKV